MNNINKIENLQFNIRQLVSQSDLPIEIIYLIFTNLYHQLSDLYEIERQKSFNLLKQQEKQKQEQENKNSQESQD